jgi:hypothetical protein
MKFIHFYIDNFSGMKENVEEIWEAIKELIAPLFMIVSRLIIITLRVLLVIFPVLQIWLANQMAYYTKNELPGLEDVYGMKAGYFRKSTIEMIIENEKQEFQEEERIREEIVRATNMEGVGS